MKKNLLIQVLLLKKQLKTNNRKNNLKGSVTTLPWRFKMRKINAQAQILDAAMKNFAENGYIGTSISQIAKEAGVSKALVFWYFEDKASLFNSLMDRFVAHCITNLDVNSPPGNALDKLENLMDTYWKFIQDNYKFVRIFMNWLMQLDTNEKERTERLRELHNKFRNILTEYLKEGVCTGYFRKSLDTSNTSLYLLSSLEGILLQLFLSEMSFEELGKDFFITVKKNLLKGILK